MPLEILDKPSRLNASEVKTVRAHPLHGLEMLRQSNEFSDAVADAIVHHHEFLDGSGYPHGLKGADIPDLTQLVTIVDIFSALIETADLQGHDARSGGFGILRRHGRKARPGAARGVRGRRGGCPDSARWPFRVSRPSTVPPAASPRPSGRGLLEPVQRFQRLARRHLVRDRCPASSVAQRIRPADAGGAAARLAGSEQRQVVDEALTGACRSGASSSSRMTRARSTTSGGRPASLATWMP